MRLIEHQHKDDHKKGVRSRRDSLSPLRSGHAVALVVRDAKMPKKRRIGDPVLFITPSSNYAGEEADARSFVFSLQGGGCEVLNIDTAKASDLWRMGLTMQTSKMLLSEIKSVLDTIGETYE